MPGPKAALDRGETHYIENNGAAALREAIAAFERRENGMDYGADEVIVTAGATEAIFLSLFGILNPGDEVIVPTPAFVLYEEIIKLCRGVFVPLPTADDGFQIDGGRLRSVMTERTRAIILNSPNNPTGCFYTEESLRAVRDAVAGKPIFVLCDDVYRRLVYENGYHSFAEFRELREQLLVIQSFSKPYAMTGWRVGYLLSDRSVKERLELLHQYMVVSTPAPFQEACMRALPVRPCAHGGDLPATAGLRTGSAQPDGAERGAARRGVLCVPLCGEDGSRLRHLLPPYDPGSGTCSHARRLLWRRRTHPPELLLRRRDPPGRPGPAGELPPDAVKFAARGGMEN